MRGLLDINVLIALLDSDHAFHTRAHAWWHREHPSWASCPLTENGLVRIMSSAGYSKVYRYSVAELVSLLQIFVANTDHAFWPDAVSLREPAYFQHDRILSSKHLTDLYLLALAVENGGCLVTFDLGIPTSAVSRAETRHLVIL